MDRCLTCGNVILEQGVLYGYAGPVCRCYEAPRVRQRASDPEPASTRFLLAQNQELRDQRARLMERVAELETQLKETQGKARRAKVRLDKHLNKETK